MIALTFQEFNHQGIFVKMVFMLLLPHSVKLISLEVMLEYNKYIHTYPGLCLTVSKGISNMMSYLYITFMESLYRC